MMKTKAFIILALLLLSLSAVQADAIKDTYQKMLDTYAKVTSWQAEINQTNTFAQAQTTLVSKGNFYYQNGKVAVYYVKPNEQYVLVKEGKVTIYDKNSQSAYRTRIDSSVQSLNPVAIIKAFWSSSDLSMSAVKDGQVRITLQPRNSKEIRKMSFYLDVKTNYVKQLSYTTKSDDTLTLVFSKLKVNKPIPEKVWILPIPKTVKITEY